MQIIPLYSHTVWTYRCSKHILSPDVHRLKRTFVGDLPLLLRRHYHIGMNTSGIVKSNANHPGQVERGWTEGEAVHVCPLQDGDTVSRTPS